MAPTMRNNTTYAVLFLSLLTLAAAPATKPADAPARIDPLPAGWRDRVPAKGSFHQEAVHTGPMIFVGLAAAPTSDYVDLTAYAGFAKANAALAKLEKNLHFTNPKPGTLAGHETLEYETTGETLSGLKLHGRTVVFRMGDWFYKIVVSTTPSHYQAAQPEVEKLVANLK